MLRDKQKPLCVQTKSFGVAEDVGLMAGFVRMLADKSRKDVENSAELLVAADKTCTVM